MAGESDLGPGNTLKGLSECVSSVFCTAALDLVVQSPGESLLRGQTLQAESGWGAALFPDIPQRCWALMLTEALCDLQGQTRERSQLFQSEARGGAYSHLFLRFDTCRTEDDPDKRTM